MNPISVFNIVMIKNNSTKAFFFISVALLAGFLLGTVKNSAHANILDDIINKIRVTQSESVTKTENNIEKTELYKSDNVYEDSIVNAIDKNSDAVISIIVSKDLPIIENCPYNPFGDLPPEFQDFFGNLKFQRPCQNGTKEQEIGGGSGFIVSEDGLVITNKHVVSDESASYTVLTNDGEKYPATVLALDPVQDIAIVKIKTDSKNLPTVNLGDSDSVRLGQTAIAIGNALGEFRNTVSVGIISGLARSIEASGSDGIEHLEGLIQTDAAINPGNSGGPLLNLKGEVIAINTAVARNAENIGFAIPINQAKRALESVEKTGKISVPYLGVRYIQISKELSEKENLPVSEGALVRGGEDGPAIVSNSPAAKAGLKTEDIITAINSEKITETKTLLGIIQKHNVGDVVRLSILREGKKQEISVKLEARP